MPHLKIELRALQFTTFYGTSFVALYTFTGHFPLAPFPPSKLATHASKRTFSTVWHWEHLVLKILAPFSADMLLL